MMINSCNINILGIIPIWFVEKNNSKTIIYGWGKGHLQRYEDRRVFFVLLLLTTSYGLSLFLRIMFCRIDRHTNIGRIIGIIPKMLILQLLH
jgi:hypothetical protein